MNIALNDKRKLLEVYRKLRAQVDKIMAQYRAMVEYALDKNKQIVWTAESNDFDQYDEKEWEKQYPYIINARKHKGVRSPEGGIYLSRVWRKGREMRVDGYGYKGRLCIGWKSDDIASIADFVCKVYPETYEVFELEICDCFTVYDGLIEEFINLALDLYCGNIRFNDEFQDIDNNLTYRLEVDYFIGVDEKGDEYSFIPKRIYREVNKIYFDGNLLNGGSIERLQLDDNANVFRSIYGMIFGKDFRHPIIGWQICMIPDKYLLGSDRILASERWIADMLRQKANGDWFVLSRRLMDDEELSDFTFRGS